MSRPTYAEVSAARSKSVIFNPVGALSTTNLGLTTFPDKRRKKSREEEKGGDCKEYAKLIRRSRETSLRAS
jgi:hypothetical protein